MTGSRQFFRTISAFMVATILLFLLNRYLALWLNWPDLTGVFAWFSEGDLLVAYLYSSSRINCTACA